ncbi:NAD(P)-dependent dehydrogenase (short-subunit alcohol dehydrogenase family) [Arthrobacter pascens]|uniref:SDR family NAD(P)-dependent oxidoreductase n=1 Tax=Arthrobacter pascens TaxID=1677 RepID=UPI0027910E64|nr:SDR family NAD(P)-dependent oxidoreductase [Arthrobacter pascens]MDQ0678587.1 NAD(P)-dependent dehydrogenase (short-subunit alcohol dehydrogenase family) [Arthrobacter pascens]
MKTTIAMIGAGPGLGLASARRFGAEGFNVALLSRTQEHVDALAAELAGAGITARGYAVDVRDHESLNTALARAADEAGADRNPPVQPCASQGTSPARS